MKLFRRAQVYALAMRLHGGPLGHEAHLKRIADQDAKSKATRRTRTSTQATAFRSWT